MLQTLFISGAHPRPSDRNMNYFQRVYFMSRKTKCTIIANKGSDYSCVASQDSNILYSPWKGKAGQIAFIIMWLLKGEAKKIDVVVTEPSILGICGYLVKLITGCKWVVDVWDIPIRFTRENGLLTDMRLSLSRKFMKRLYKRADLFIVSIVPDFEFRYYEVPVEKIINFPNAIWQQELTLLVPLENNRQNDFSIICMRSLHTHEMGLDTLTEAFLIVREKIPGLTLTIIGSIPADVSPQITQLEKDRQVNFIEFVEHDTLITMIHSASVCVIPFKDVPDLAQTYPIKLLEYLASGRPVIASNIAGMSSLIEDGVNGLLYKAGDADDLANKILILYHDEQLRNSITKAAIQYDERYDCQKKNGKIITALQKLVSGPNLEVFD